MPVYPLTAWKPSCTSPGCWCRDRVPRYPSDLDDAQWAVLEPQARAVMAELAITAGRPMTHDLRAMCDAVFYVVRDGVEWRALPADFPPWDAVYAFYDRWSARGLPQALVCRLREKLRVRQGRGAQPTASIVDSQIVKAADTVPRASSGYHGGKKITGRGPVCRSRCRGLAAGAGGHCRQRQRPGRAKLLVIRLDAFGTLKIMWADSGYDGAPLAAWIRAVAGITLEVVRRCDPHAFQVVRRRWVVERTFGWLMRY